MNSRNNPGQNEKQRELVNRLEEIRQKRRAAEGDFAPQTPRRNEGEQQRPTRQTRRNTNQQRRRSLSQPADTGQFSQPSYRKEPTIDERESISSAASIPDVKQVSEITDIGQTAAAKKKTSKTTKNLTHTLSDGNSLANAIIINEVLSKPIALKRRYR